MNIETEKPPAYLESDNDGVVDLPLLATEQWPQLKQDHQPLYKRWDSFLELV